MKCFFLLLLMVSLNVTASVNAVAATPSYKLADTIKLGGEPRWDFIYADSSQHRVYVSHGSQTEVIDAHRLEVVGTVAIGSKPEVAAIGKNGNSRFSTAWCRRQASGHSGYVLSAGVR